MKLREITDKTDQELAKMITDQRAELAQTVLELRTKEVKDVKHIARLKRTIARALTIQRQREITHEEAAS